MSVYLDASVLVSLFCNDALTDTAEEVLSNLRQTLVVSDFGATEFSSAVGRRVRMKSLTRREAQLAFAAFDGWTLHRTMRVHVQASDVATADTFVRRLDLSLRAPDALNIAVAQRAAERLATFDRRMADCAQKLGVAVVTS